MVKNPYVDMTDLELKEIYYDILVSKKGMHRAESLVPYATQIKENLGGDFTLREAIECAKRDFYDEISKRFFEGIN